MYTGKLVFSQLMDHLPWDTFHRYVKRYNGNYKVKSFVCSEQYRCMAFAQLAFRESLRDAEVCLRAQQSRLYHMGIKSKTVSRNTLANANSVRDWRIYEDFAKHLIRKARLLYRNDDNGLDIPDTVYALDSSTIDLCLALFPWAHFRRTKSAVKLHALLDLCGNIPAFIHISDGKLHDVNILDQLVLEPGAFYVMDRAYLDFSRLHRLHQSMCFFVLQTKKNTQYRRTDSSKVDRSTGLICDQTVKLTGIKSKKDFPESLRVVKYRDKERNKELAFITNNFSLPAMTICELYRNRWHVELFFKWIKQHLRIKKFYGVSENAVKTQIWIAVSVYVLIAIVKKRLGLEESFHTILQILSLTLFEKIPLDQLLTTHAIIINDSVYHNQLKLFN